MEAFTVCGIFMVFLVGSTNSYECNEPNSTLCLDPPCIQASANILKVMDRFADPCQDFYQYACGNYEEATHIPAGKLKWTPFRQTELQNRKLVRKILQRDGYDYKGVRSEALYKAKAYFETCLNDTANEKAGFAPLLNLIESFGGWSMLGEGSGTGQDGGSLMRTLAGIYKVGVQALFAMDIGLDEKNASLNILQFQQYGLSLDSPENYEADGYSRLNAFIELGATVVTLLRDPSGDGERRQMMREARTRMKAIVEFERALGKLYVKNEKLLDRHATYNKMPLQKLMTMMPDVDMATYITEIFGREIDGTTDVVVYTPSFFRQLNDLVRNTPESLIRDYSMWYLVQNLLAFLPKAFRDARFEYTKSYSGATSQIELGERCMSEVDINFDMVTGALFVEAKSSEAAKQKSLEMLHEIRNAFLEAIPSVSWMTDKSRAVMEDKARAITEKIGYPDWILEPEKLDAYYEELTVTTSSRLDNIVYYNTFIVQSVLDDLGVPFKKERWSLGPTKVQAEYDLYSNEMTFTSGILQPPFFNNDAPMSLNFGAIGMIMAHELIHGFDDEGIKVDQFGNYGDWGWSPTAFNKKTQCLVEQYSNYRVDGRNIDGRQTLSENIADNGGVKIAYIALQNWLATNGRDMELPLHATASQEFFLGMGQIWCSYYAPKEAKQRLTFSPYSNERFRVIGSLSNLPAFSEAFQCPQGSTMNPARKCEVW